MDANIDRLIEYFEDIPLILAFDNSQEELMGAHPEAPMMGELLFANFQHVADRRMET